MGVIDKTYKKTGCGNFHIHRDKISTYPLTLADLHENFDLTNPSADLCKSRAIVGIFLEKKVVQIYAKESRANIGIFQVEPCKRAAPYRTV